MVAGLTAERRPIPRPLEARERGFGGTPSPSTFQTISKPRRYRPRIWAVARRYDRSAVRAAAFAAAVCFVGASPDGPSPAPSPAGLTGEAIYLRAVRAMRAEAVPAYVIFAERIRSRNLFFSCGEHGLDVALRHGDQETHYRVWYRSRDGESVSVEDPSGGRCDETLLPPVDSPHEHDDLFGPKPTPTPSDETAAPNGLPIIAAVHADAAHHYRISLVDEEEFEGHPVYRLTLKAYGNRDSDYPLTGMLVDRDDFLVRQATGEISIHLVVASGWAGLMLTFDRAGQYWVVRDEHIEVAGNALFLHLRAVIDVDGSDFSYPATLPEGVFPSPSPSPTARG
jgi:hypothetical protein